MVNPSDILDTHTCLARQIPVASDLGLCLDEGHLKRFWIVDGSRRGTLPDS
ncbi:hypothetical protein IE4872_PA00043 (plasmid) [Rhizobium gallicum]|uniref:Uncharacterized protein n=1 Tax=Rhizobium gallicum TaxID=56730 RepID=A0A1L5NPG0_9HYPH|nr:hypothetical protein IE4872_PA00043 [Rhizobium gallicum]